MGRLADKIGAGIPPRNFLARNSCEFTPRLNHVGISHAPFNIQQLHRIAEYGVVALGHQQRGHVDDVARLQHGQELGINASVVDTVHQDVGACGQSRLGSSKLRRVHCGTQPESVRFGDSDLYQSGVTVEIFAGMIDEQNLDEIGVSLCNPPHDLTRVFRRFHQNNSRVGAVQFGVRHCRNKRAGCGNPCASL